VEHVTSGEKSSQISGLEGASIVCRGAMAAGLTAGECSMVFSSNIEPSQRMCIVKSDLLLLFHNLLNSEQALQGFS
jgi:hypothetical protein